MSCDRARDDALKSVPGRWLSRPRSSKWKCQHCCQKDTASHDRNCDWIVGRYSKHDGPLVGPDAANRDLAMELKFHKRCARNLVSAKQS